MGSERRKYVRIRSDELVTFTPFSGSPSLGQGGDVSMGGIRFKAVGCTRRNGDLMRVSFNLADQTVDAVGRVVGVKPIDDIATEIRLEFVQIDLWAMRLFEEVLADEPAAAADIAAQTEN